MYSFSYFLWVYSSDFFSNLWWTQSSLPLSFYSKVSTYSHTFSSKYCYFILERLVCMFYTMLAMEVRYPDLLQKMSCGDIIDWQVPVAFSKATLPQAAQSQWLSTARVPGQGNFAEYGTLLMDSPGLCDCLKLFLWNPPSIFFSLFADVSLASQSEGPMAYSCSLPLCPSKTFPQSSSWTSNSALVSTS